MALLPELRTRAVADHAGLSLPPVLLKDSMFLNKVVPSPAFPSNNWLIAQAPMAIMDAVADGPILPSLMLKITVSPPSLHIHTEE